MNAHMPWRLSTKGEILSCTDLLTLQTHRINIEINLQKWYFKQSNLLRNRGLEVMNELSWLFCKITIYKHIYYFWDIACCKLNKQMKGGIYLRQCTQPRLFLFGCANYSVGVTVFGSIDQCSTLPLDSYAIPNCLIKLSCFGFGNDFVKMLAKLSSVAQYWSRILLETSFSCTKWCWMLMCLVRLWLIALLE